jgi:RimJ/RimL family protein N-acetyltransferase
MRHMEHFTTARLVARDWTADDAQAAFDIYGRHEVMRWLGAQPRRPVPTLEAMRERLAIILERGAEQPGYGLWPLALRVTGTVVGAVLLQPLPGDDGEVEIGWHLNPDHWGHGYATEAGRGVLALAFGPGRHGRPPDRVLAVVDPDNARSQAVCRRLGMTHLGQTEQYYDLTLELFELRRDAFGGPAAAR